MRLMDTAELAEAVSMLAAYLSRPVGEAALRIYVEEIGQVTREAELIATAFGGWMRSHAATAMIPSPLELAAIVRDAGAARAARLHSQGLHLPPVSRASTPHGRDALRLIRQIQAGKVPPQERVAAFRAMAASYPGHGWANAADELEAQLAGRKDPALSEWRETDMVFGKKGTVLR